MAERRVFIIQPTAQRRPQINPNIAAFLLLIFTQPANRNSHVYLKDERTGGYKKRVGLSSTEESKPMTVPQR